MTDKNILFIYTLSSQRNFSPSASSVIKLANPDYFDQRNNTGY